MTHPGTQGAGEPRIEVLPDADAVSAATADRIAGALAAAADARGRADWATTGGSAAIGVYRALAAPPRRDRVPWAAVQLWWGDDRFVPRDHPLSNVMPADQALLSRSALSGQSGSGEDAHDVRSGADAGVGIPPTQVHPIPAAVAIGRGEGPAWAASRYEQALRASGIEVRDGWPVFDLVILGMGPDGHILSVFPGSEALDDDRAWVLPIPAPTHVEPHVERVTLNPRIVTAAREVLVAVHGEGKAEVMAAILGQERDPHRWPAQIARISSATWLLDEAVAAQLPAGARR
jgi:6-phosphogluconolactonase